ncbi:MAG: single-stranded-DNA-specific exonuclease RecJ [Calditrichaeota bacterium]|nr:MAG: single-stranded-DNA-specific exonuclease RecJ [Calditrichota bacterium]
MIEKKWKVLNEDITKPIIDRILENRGISPKEKETYLNPDFSRHQHDPFLMEGMEVAVKRIIQALRKKEHILVFGDYDADGVTATTLLYDFFREAEANVSFILPHRMVDGYGITPKGVRKAHKRGANLIITVDNGISAVDAVIEANSLGIDVIITDHHKQNGELPPAYVVVNPNQNSCSYPFKGIAGVGVAYKVVQAVGSKIWHQERLEKFIRWNLDLVAMGTVADICPMVDENRVFVTYGLQVIGKSKREGIKALLRVTGDPTERIDTQTIGFRLGPRLNAAGRLEAADKALNLLLSKTPEEAMKIANELNKINSRRQEFTAQGLSEAEEMINPDEKMLIVSSKTWHPGIIGLISGRLTEKYGRPSLVLTLGHEEGKFAGSGRSIESFDITNAFSQVEELLLSYGGHKQAGGMALTEENLETVKERILDYATTTIEESDLIPIVNIDTEISTEDATMETIEAIKTIGPFGERNRIPVFALRNTRVLNVRTVGYNDQHLKMSVRKNNRFFECIGFNLGDLIHNLKYGDMVDIAFNLLINSWNGKRTIQLRLIDVKNKSSQNGNGIY